MISDCDAYDSECFLWTGKDSGQKSAMRHYRTEKALMFLKWRNIRAFLSL